jgi:hypothetical protein
MVEIKNVEVYGLERAINASYNPMSIGDIDTTKPLPENWTENRKKLTSVPVGSGHDTCLSGILVTFDIKYPLYWTPQAQRYHWLQIVSSQSKMHRLMKMGKDQNFDKMFECVKVNKRLWIKNLENQDLLSRVLLVKNYKILHDEFSGKSPIFKKYLGFSRNRPFFKKWSFFKKLVVF